MTQATPVPATTDTSWIREYLPPLEEWQVWTFGRRGCRRWMLSARISHYDSKDPEALANQTAKDFSPTCWGICIIHIQAKPDGGGNP